MTHESLLNELWQATLSDSGNWAMVARLKDIQRRLADEIWVVERLIAVTTPARFH